MRHDGGPAFPRPIGSDEDYSNEAQVGMSLRDYFAGQALNSFMSDPNWNPTPEDNQLHAAKVCYQIADAMLEARKR